MKNEHGNALFLILIAVALFAALSYAVTQSGGGGGTIDKEQNIIKTALLMDQASLIKNHIQRLYILNEVDQVRFDDSSYDGNGTVYISGGSTAIGRTVGVFNADEGISKLYPPIELWDGVGLENNFAWVVMPNQRLTVGGNEVGTVADDEILIIGELTIEACAQINKHLTGSTVIPLYSRSGPSNRLFEKANRDGTYTNSSNLENRDVTLLPGCNRLGVTHIYIDIIKQN